MRTFFYRFQLLFILVSILLLTILFGHLVPTIDKSFFYALSLSIKNILVFFLPLIIFVFLWSTLISLQSQAGKFIILLLLLVPISNFISIMSGYAVAVNFSPLIDFNWTAVNPSLQLQPAWNFDLPPIVSTKSAMLASIILGLFFAFKPNHHINSLAQKFNAATIYFLKRFFIPILPIFILGFLFKLEHENILSTLVSAYGPILLLIVLTQFSYIIVMYVVAANFSPTKLATYLRNILPATITAFSTMSSAATLPITMIGTEKNLSDKTFARFIIPATCNIHSLGSGIGFTIMALATMKAFNMELPNFANFIVFATYYTLAKFAVAGIPGGVIVVATPLLEIYLGFTPEMIGIITAVYLLFDTFGTAGNVAGNGAFAIIFSKIYHANIIKKLFKKI